MAAYSDVLAQFCVRVKKTHGRICYCCSHTEHAVKVVITLTPTLTLTLTHAEHTFEFAISVCLHLDELRSVGLG